MNRQENEFAIGRLPHQEIRKPLLARGADDEIRVRNARGVEMAGDYVRIDAGGIERACSNLLGNEARRRGDLLAAAIIESDNEIETAC